MTYKNIVTGLTSFTKYHDDMNAKDQSCTVEVVPFPYMHIFGDFRIFNGINLEDMDQFIGRIREIFVEIANIHAANDREEKIENMKKLEGR